MNVNGPFLNTSGPRGQLQNAWQRKGGFPDPHDGMPNIQRVLGEKNAATQAQSASTDETAKGLAPRANQDFDFNAIKGRDPVPGRLSLKYFQYNDMPQLNDVSLHTELRKQPGGCERRHGDLPDESFCETPFFMAPRAGCSSD